MAYCRKGETTLASLPGSLLNNEGEERAKTNKSLSHNFPTHLDHKCPTHLRLKCPNPISQYVLILQLYVHVEILIVITNIDVPACVGGPPLDRQH